ncbi:MAG: ATPase, T2SS/T4P/T4SS family, partial [Gemmatimonadaceae bacterium]
MERIIKAAIDRGASDLHIKAGDVFRARIDGKLVALTTQTLTPDQTRAIALRLLPTEADRARVDDILDYDCSWGLAGVGRFRVNISRQRSSLMVVMRVIPMQVPTIRQLGLPALLEQIAQADRGMVLVTGAAGSGKSSTIAGLVDHVNTTSAKHVITLENPVEF